MMSNMYSGALMMLFPLLFSVVWLVVIFYLFSLAGRLVRAVEQIAEKLPS